MKISTYIFSVIGSAIIVYGIYAVIVVSVAQRSPSVDATKGQSTIFQTEAKYVVYNTPRIAHDAIKPEVVILGASNASLGLRPEQMSPLLKNIQVHNLAIGGQNMRSLSQLVDLIYRQTPKERRKNIIFLIGTWYGLTIDDTRRWPDGNTDVDDEMLRYGLFKKTIENHLESRVPNRYLSLGIESVWPLMVPYSVYAQLGRYFVKNSYISFIPDGVILPWYKSIAERNSSHSSKAMLEKQMMSFVKYVGPISGWNGSGFHDLESISNRIQSEGGQLILLDMPLTSWAMHTEAYPHYMDLMRSQVSKLQIKNSVRYLNIQSIIDDDGFFDAIHPRPKVTQKIADIAIIPILSALNSLKSANVIGAPRTLSTP